MFDLFWLTKPQLAELGKHHHTALDEPKTVGTEINVHSTSRNIVLQLDSIDKPWAKKFLLEKMENRRLTCFTLTDALLEASTQLGISIHFKEIEKRTNKDSVESLLQQLFSQEGNRHGVEK